MRLREGRAALHAVMASGARQHRCAAAAQLHSLPVSQTRQVGHPLCGRTLRFKNRILLSLLQLTTSGAKTINKNTNSTQNKSQTHRPKQYEVT